jgi:hypothetical protein
LAQLAKLSQNESWGEKNFDDVFSFEMENDLFE